jgi:hypothetical protein
MKETPSGGFRSAVGERVSGPEAWGLSSWPSSTAWAWGRFSAGGLTTSQIGKPLLRPLAIRWRARGPSGYPLSREATSRIDVKRS